MNESKKANKKTIRLRDEVPADFDTQRLEKICGWCKRRESIINGHYKLCHKLFNSSKLEKENTRALMQALHGCRKNCRECREEEEEYYPETKVEQKGVKHA